MGDKPWPASSRGSICSRIARQRSNSACQSIGRACATAASIGSIIIAASVCFMSRPACPWVALTFGSYMPARLLKFKAKFRLLREHRSMHSCRFPPPVARTSDQRLNDLG
jgi:hypothetical protein